MIGRDAIERSRFPARKDEETRQAVEDWLYWVARGDRF